MNTRIARLALDSAQAWIATVESVVGIVIEGAFVAMLIQRFSVANLRAQEPQLSMPAPFQHLRVGRPPPGRA
jgi:hypothetical protein